MTSVSREPESYAYQPLDPRQIRIFTLNPGDSESPLSGDLLIISVDDDDLVYDALSYMWGDPSPADVIYLAGRALPIAANLTIALHHLRYTHKPLTIWIDAICINQDDTTERMLQIQLMRFIFTRANIVRIFINEPDVDERSEALSALIHFSDASDHEVETLGPNPGFWDPVAKIFSNPYWNRAWIQQEVLNARQLSLHCARIIIPGASFKRFQLALREWQYLTLYTSGALARQWVKHIMPFISSTSPAITDLAEYGTGNTFWGLLELLSKSGDLTMTDPRDRVYALMHLAEDYEEDGIKVDYTKDEVEILIEAVVYHIRKARNIDFLRESSLHEGQCSIHVQEECPRLPSWLPRTWLGCQRYTNVEQREDEPECPTLCLPDSVLAVERRLRIRGLRIDRVRRSLTSSLDPFTMTIGQFWSSSLGIYLRVFAGFKVQNLPSQLYSILLDDSIEPHPTYDAMVSALSQFLSLAQDQRYAKRRIGIDGALIMDLLETFDEASRVALDQILEVLYHDVIFIAERGSLGLLGKCELSEGNDEIWIALGSSLPLVLRPIGKGRYRHVGAAYIPKLEDFQLIYNLSNDVQPGDKVGEWTVMDIEIE
ncbi:Nn.00g031160.m01.CDS01 [Neocucurbitaria sp. VM-36]